MNNIFICVITCRRPQWLARLLDSLLALEVDETINPTIVVVDNADDDASREVVAARQQQADNCIPIIYDVEKKAGIVHARNRCVDIVLENKGDYLVFIDDDEWPHSSDWLNRLYEGIEAHNADVVTSNVISVGEKGTPDWAVDLIYGKNPYRHGQIIDVFYTNNVLIKRAVIEQLAPCFDVRFAMTGASDYHFSLRASQAGYRCVYVDAPVIEEFPKSRANVKWFLKRGFRSGIGYTRSHLFEEPLAKAVARCLMMAGARGVFGLGKMLKGMVTFNKLTLVGGLFVMSSAVGTVASFFGIKHEEYNVIHGK